MDGTPTERLESERQTRRARPGSRLIAGLLVRRLLWLVPVVLSVLVVTFLLVRLAPGNPWQPGTLAEGSSARLSESAVRHLNEKYGLAQPWWEQLLLYLRNALTLDLGESYRYQGREVAELLGTTWPKTLTVGALAFGVTIPLGIGLGVAAALRQNSWIDYAVTGLATVGASVPNFVLGIFLIVLLSVVLPDLTGGALSLPPAGFGLDERLVMPVATLSVLPVAFISRLARSSTLETLRQDHVRTARAKGVPERRVALHHVVKNALVPVVTALGPLFAFLITGGIVVEQLFGIPGLGSLFIDAVATRDYPVILGTTLVYALVFAVSNALVDAVYLLVDPRMRPG